MKEKCVKKFSFFEGVEDKYVDRWIINVQMTKEIKIHVQTLGPKASFIMEYFQGGWTLGVSQ